MKKDSYIQLRVSLQRKSDWKYVAAQQGLSLSAWLERLANDACEASTPLEEEAEEKRAEHRLRVRRVGVGKRSYEPDFRT